MVTMTLVTILLLRSLPHGTSTRRQPHRATPEIGADKVKVITKVNTDKNVKVIGEGHTNDECPLFDILCRCR